MEHEQTSEWFVCPGSLVNGGMVCNEPTCSAYPIICAEEECACQEPHRNHPQLCIPGYLDKMNEPLVVTEELKQAEKAMKGLIDSMANIINRCRDRHRRLMDEYLAQHYRFTWLRHMLINRQQPDVKDMTGGNMAKMLGEIEQVKLITSPYTMGAEGIEREAVQLHDKMQTVVSTVERLWNFKIAQDARLNPIH
jgi:hypothetical protein